MSKVLAVYPFNEQAPGLRGRKKGAIVDTSFMCAVNASAALKNLEVEAMEWNFLPTELQPGGTGVRAWRERWGFGVAISRLNRRPDPRFSQMAGKVLTVSEIEAFFPHLRGLTWEEIEGSDLSHGEWSAQEGDYRINFFGGTDSGAWHHETMAVWRELLAT